MFKSEIKIVFSFLESFSMWELIKVWQIGEEKGKKPKI